jgi:hypothetical protein
MNRFVKGSVNSVVNTPWHAVASASNKADVCSRFHLRALRDPFHGHDRLLAQLQRHFYFEGIRPLAAAL